MTDKLPILSGKEVKPLVNWVIRSMIRKEVISISGIRSGDL
jgi:hypothetical protein